MSWPTNCTCTWTSCWSRWTRMPRKAPRARFPTRAGVLCAHVPVREDMAAGIVTGEGGELPADFASPAAELQSQLGMSLVSTPSSPSMPMSVRNLWPTGLPCGRRSAGPEHQRAHRNDRECVRRGERTVNCRRSGAITSTPSSPTPRHWRGSDEAAQDAAQDRLTGFELRVRELPVHLHRWATGYGRPGGRVHHA